MNWSLETWKIGDIHENENNPRLLSKEQAKHLRKSIERFGVCEPLVINRDGHLIGGHQRCKTLKMLGRRNAPVYVPDRILTEEEVAELSIRLNKAVGEWDYDVLANCWDADNLVDWGFSLEELGMSDPIDEEKPYKGTITISVEDEGTLEAVENEVKELLVRYHLNATYKVKVK